MKLFDFCFYIILATIILTSCKKPYLEDTINPPHVEYELVDSIPYRAD